MTLSGLVSDSSAPEIGEISGVNAFISGEILEVGQDFKVSVKLTDVSTAEVIDTYTFNIDGDTMIDASVALQYSYVAANGIGVSLSPRYMITLPEQFNSTDMMLKIIFDISAKYRISKDFLMELGVWIPPLNSSGARFYGSSNLSYEDIQPGLTGTALGGSNAGLDGFVTNFWMTHVDAQYTINFVPQFNLGIRLGFVSSGGVSVKIRSKPYYDTVGWPDPDAPPDISAIEQETRGFILNFNPVLGGKLEIAPEFFITPRFAVSAVIGYILTAGGQCSEAILSSGGLIDPDDYYGYDPSLMPDGTPWTFNFSGLYGGITLSMFF